MGATFRGFVVKQLAHGGSFLFGSQVKRDNSRHGNHLRNNQATKWRCPAKLRSLMAIDRALNFQPTQVSDEDIAKATEQIQNAGNWRDVFGGIALVKLTADGTGSSIALRITKNEGIPVRVVKDGETADGVVAIRNVSDTDRYCYSSNDLAESCDLTPPKIRALIAHLKIKDDSALFKEIRFGRTAHSRYSQEALKKLREELPNCDMDEIWRHHTLGSRKPR